MITDNIIHRSSLSTEYRRQIDEYLFLVHGIPLHEKPGLDYVSCSGSTGKIVVHSSNGLLYLETRVVYLRDSPCLWDIHDDKDQIQYLEECRIFGGDEQ